MHRHPGFHVVAAVDRRSRHPRRVVGAVLLFIVALTLTMAAIAAQAKAAGDPALAVFRERQDGATYLMAVLRAPEGPSGKPVLSDLRMVFSDGAGAEVRPGRRPSLRAGETATLAARVSDESGGISVEGLRDGMSWSYTLPLGRARPADGIADHWRAAGDAPSDPLLHRAAFASERLAAPPVEPAAGPWTLVLIGLVHLGLGGLLIALVSRRRQAV